MSDGANVREYVSVDALKNALTNLMARYKVESWIQTAFDASDIADLIDGQAEEDYITISVKVVEYDVKTGYDVEVNS